ncbi:MAG: hypothetical protein H0W08_22795 [Acidobacteria bacterium]|nr:hypothetical protein [Acidobacteriota bacterium]
MRALVESLGVDYIQWRALVRAYVWIDYAALFGAFGRVEARRRAVQLALAWGFLSLLGLGLAGTVWSARDPFLAALLVITTMMMWAGMMVLTQQAGLAAPDDHELIGFRPVASRTFFAVRLTALMVPALETIALAGWLPVVAFLTRADGSFRVALAAGVAFTASAIFVTLAVVALFGWLMRVVHPARLTRALSYAGGAAGITLVTSMMFGIQHFTETDDPGAWLTTIVPRDWRTMWFPPAWFAAYIPIASGTGRATDFTVASLSLVVLVAVSAVLRGRVSADYVERVATFASLSMPRAPVGRTWRRITDERRAVALLVWSHLRRDVRFQMAIVTNVAMGVIFTVTSSSFKTSGADPFDAGEAAAVAPLFALLFVPTQIYHTLVGSSGHGASWLFFSTPADRTRLVVGARDAVGVFILLPVSLLLAGFYIYRFSHPAHAFLHATFLGLMAYASLQLNVLLTPRLPFSIPMTGLHRSSGIPIYSTILLMLIGAPFFVLFQLFAYRSALHAAIGLAALLLVITTLNRYTRRRVNRRTSSLVYIP